MRRALRAFAIAACAVAGLSASGYAGAHGHGGFRGGGHGWGGWHGWGSGHNHGHCCYHSGVYFVGWGWGYWPYDWYYYPYYPWPPVPPPDVTFIEKPELEEEEARAPHWYYCYDPAGYYPTVPQCNGDWYPVAPLLVQPSADKTSAPADKTPSSATSAPAELIP